MSVSDSIILSCDYKNCLYKDNLDNLIQHIFLVHSNDFNFQIKCFFENCNKWFVNLNIFKNHLRSSKHKNKEDP